MMPPRSASSRHAWQVDKLLAPHPALRENRPVRREAHAVGKRRGAVPANLRKPQVRKLDDGVVAVLTKTRDRKARKPQHFLYLGEPARFLNELIRKSIGIIGVFEDPGGHGVSAQKQSVRQIHAHFVYTAWRSALNHTNGVAGTKKVPNRHRER